MSDFSNFIECCVLLYGIYFMFKYNKLKIEYKKLEEKYNSIYMKAFGFDDLSRKDKF